MREGVTIAEGPSFTALRVQRRELERPRSHRRTIQLRDAMPPIVFAIALGVAAASLVLFGAVVAVVRMKAGQ